MGLLGGTLQRNVIPMGRPEIKKEYPKTATYRQVVKDAGMSPENVDVIADGDDVDLDSNINETADITIMPKQKGG